MIDADIIINYGYWGVFLWSALDHTGTPSALIVSMSLVVVGKLDLVPTMLFAFAGALIYDLSLYFLARLSGAKILRILDKKTPKLNEAINKFEIMFRKYGSNIIIWGRFLAIVSRLIPIICGVLKIRYIKFIVHSIIGNLIMNFIIGYLIFLFWNEVDNYIQNPSIIFYLSISLIIIQLLFTWIRVKVKNH